MIDKPIVESMINFVWNLSFLHESSAMLQEQVCLYKLTVSCTLRVPCKATKVDCGVWGWILSKSAKEKCAKKKCVEVCYGEVCYGEVC